MCMEHCRRKKLYIYSAKNTFRSQPDRQLPYSRFWIVFTLNGSYRYFSHSYILVEEHSSCDTRIAQSKKSRMEQIVLYINIYKDIIYTCCGIRKWEDWIYIYIHRILAYQALIVCMVAYKIHIQVDII